MSDERIHEGKATGKGPVRNTAAAWRALDRRGAMAGLVVLRVVVMFVFAAVCEAVNYHFVGPSAQFEAEVIEGLCLTGWMLGMTAEAGLLAAWGAGNLLVRTLWAMLLATLALAAYLLCQYLANLGPPGDPAAICVMWLILLALVVLELASYSALTGYRLAWRGVPIQPSRKWNQFRIWELLLVMLVTAVALGSWRLWDIDLSALALWRSLGGLTLAGQVALLSFLCVAVFLASFSRLKGWLLPLVAVALCSANTVLVLSVHHPVATWADAAGEILLYSSFVHAAAAICCAMTGIGLRWIGYELVRQK